METKETVLSDLRTHAISMPIIFFFVVLEFLDYTHWSNWLFDLTSCPKITKKYFLALFMFCLGYAYYQYVILNYLKIDYKSPINFMGVSSDKYCGFTKWSWTHLFAYYIYSFICPFQWLFVGIVGVGYEVLELFLGHFCGEPDYWTSSSQTIICFDDVKANLMGYILGHIVQYFLGFKL